MRKLDYTILFIFLIIIYFLTSTGIRWGIPSKERFELVVSSRQEVLNALPGIKAFMKNSRWQYSHRENIKGVSKYAVYFDQLRSYHSDEIVVLKSLGQMKPRKLDFHPRTFIYPPLLTFIDGGWIAIKSLLGLLTLKSNIDYYLTNPWEFGKLYIAARQVNIFFYAFMIFFLYGIGVEFFNRTVALFSAVFALFLPMIVINAHYIKHDLPSAAFTTASLYYFLKISRDGRARDFYLAGLFAGLSAAIKHSSGLIVLGIIPAHFFYLLKTLNTKDAFKNLLTTPLIWFTPPLAMIIFFVLNPYCLIDYKEFAAELVVDLAATRHTFMFKLNHITLQGYVFFKYLVTPPLFILLSASFIHAVFHRKYYIWVLFLSVLPLTMLELNGAMGSSAHFIPVFSAYLLMAGFSLNRFLILCSASKTGKLFGVFLVVVIIGCEMGYVNAYEKIFTSTDVRLETGNWVNKNIEKTEKIGIQQYPVIFLVPPISNPQRLVDYNNKPLDNTADIPEYFVVSKHNVWRQLRFIHLDDKSSFRKWFEEKYKLIKKFEIMPSPFGIKLTKPAGYRLPPSLEHLCPTFFVYKLKRGV